MERSYKAAPASTSSIGKSCRSTYVSVIVPVYNGEATILGCLDSLAYQTYPTDKYEIVVVDDGSTDRSPAVVKAWQTGHSELCSKLVVQKNAGPASARNHGAQEAVGSILLFTDADCVPEPDWIERLTAPFDDAGIVGAKGAYLCDQTGLVPRFVQAEYEDRYDRMLGRERIDFIDTYSAAYRRDVFLANGGFDIVFSTASVEDQEFSYRLAERGYRMVFVPDARVKHQHDRTITEYARRKYFIGYWKALVMRRFPERAIHDSHTPQALKVQIALLAGLASLSTLSMIVRFAPLLRIVRKSLPAIVMLFLLSATPFLHKLARRSGVLALASLGLLFVRAAALGSGYLVGMVRFFLARSIEQRIRE